MKQGKSFRKEWIWTLFLFSLRSLTLGQQFHFSSTSVFHKRIKKNMGTRYLCEPSIITDNYISMYLIRTARYDIKHNYVILEVLILL
jgi:hypothetical protein